MPLPSPKDNPDRRIDQAIRPDPSPTEKEPDNWIARLYEEIRDVETRLSRKIDDLVDTVENLAHRE